MVGENPADSGGSLPDAKETLKEQLSNDPKFMELVSQLAKKDEGTVSQWISQLSQQKHKGLAQAAKKPTRQHPPAAPTAPTATVVPLKQQLNDRSSPNVEVMLKIGDVPVTVTLSPAELMTEMSAQGVDIGKLFNTLVASRGQKGASANPTVTVLTSPKVTLQLIVGAKNHKVRWEVRGSVPVDMMKASHGSATTKLFSQADAGISFYCFKPQSDAIYLDDDPSGGPSVSRIVRIAAALDKRSTRKVATAGTVTRGYSLGGEELLIVGGGAQPTKEAVAAVLTAAGAKQRVVDSLGTVMGAPGHEWVPM